MTTEPTASDPNVLVRDMGYTEAEWLRVLPAAMGHWPWKQEGRRVEAQAAGGGLLELSWAPLPSRRLGLAVIPRMEVVFRGNDIAAEEFAEWLARFDLYTRRGGG